MNLAVPSGIVTLRFVPELGHRPLAKFPKILCFVTWACIVSFVDLDGIVGTSAPVGDSIFSNHMMVGGYWRIRDLIPRESPGPLKVNRCLTTALLNAA